VSPPDFSSLNLDAPTSSSQATGPGSTIFVSNQLNLSRLFSSDISLLAPPSHLSMPTPVATTIILDTATTRPFILYHRSRRYFLPVFRGNSVAPARRLNAKLGFAYNHGVSLRSCVRYTSRGPPPNVTRSTTTRQSQLLKEAQQIRRQDSWHYDTAIR
jgi:hypothetical protein